MSNFAIESILIVVGFGCCDRVSLISNLKGPFSEEVNENHLWLNFETPAGDALKYCEQNFKGIQIEVIEARKRS